LIETNEEVNEVNKQRRKTPLLRIKQTKASEYTLATCAPENVIAGLNEYVHTDLTDFYFGICFIGIR
jgi:hypothetical protein